MGRTHGIQEPIAGNATSKTPLHGLEDLRLFMQVLDDAEYQRQGG